MRYRVVHHTRYDYSQPVALAHSEARLQPRATPTQTCLQSTVDIDPLPAERAMRTDAFGNPVLYFALQAPHDALIVTATSEVDVAPPPTGGPPRSAAWEEARRVLRTSADPEQDAARQFAVDSAGAPALAEAREFAQPCFTSGRPLLEAVADLSGRIYREFTFEPQSTTIATPLSEVLAQRHGVCQDFAHLALSCLRAFGLPGRYISGYLETVPLPGQPRLQGADVSHAWFAVYVPEVGWVDFDPTNDLQPSGRHVTIAWGRDYGDVTPLKGIIFGGGPHTLEVSVDMARL